MSLIQYRIVAHSTRIAQVKQDLLQAMRIRLNVRLVYARLKLAFSINTI